MLLFALGLSYPSNKTEVFAVYFVVFTALKNDLKNSAAWRLFLCVKKSVLIIKNKWGKYLKTGEWLTQQLVKIH